MDPATRLNIMEELSKRSDGQLRQFFLAQGYHEAYSLPRLAKSSKASRVASAFGNAEYYGRLDELLAAAADYLGISIPNEVTDGRVASEPGRPVLAREPGEQARQVRAWFNLFDEHPTVQVVNNSDAAVRDIVPTVTVTDRAGGAMLGGTPLWNAALAELPPFRAFAWRMDHLRSPSAASSVESHLVVDFTDAGGVRWQIGHDRLVEVDPIDSASLGYVDLVDPPAQIEQDDLPLSVAAEASAEANKRVFLSYVREDSSIVDRLQSILESEGVEVWRDRDALFPGDNWKDEIRRAISAGSFAFIACFSAASVNKSKSYMNEELALAVDELRMRNTTHWFLPALLTDCSPPSIDIGIHGRLGDIHQCRLFVDWDREARRLLASIRRLA